MHDVIGSILRFSFGRVKGHNYAAGGPGDEASTLFIVTT